MAISRYLTRRSLAMRGIVSDLSIVFPLCREFGAVVSGRDRWVWSIGDYAEQRCCCTVSWITPKATACLHHRLCPPYISPLPFLVDFCIPGTLSMSSWMSAASCLVVLLLTWIATRCTCTESGDHSHLFELAIGISVRQIYEPVAIQIYILMRSFIFEIVGLVVFDAGCSTRNRFNWSVTWRWNGSG